MKNHPWLSKLKQYEGSNLRSSVIQIITSFLPYFGLMAAMLYLMVNSCPYWTVMLLSLPAAGFLIRIFIIFHDCTHNSFFNSQRACSIIGNIGGVLTFTSYADWKRAHALHHANVAKLEKRGIGDVWTMTVGEYREAGKWKKLSYRVFRNPFVLLAVGPIIIFLVFNRLPKEYTRKKEHISLALTNVAILGIIALAWFTVGIWNYVLVQLPVIYFAGVIGIWLFYVQHQYEDVYWSEAGNWDPVRASLEGSSYYKLPAILRWFSGNIGFHHIHHLKPRIPNYNLKPCIESVEELQAVRAITFTKGLKSLFLRLWDEESGKMVGFKYFKAAPSVKGNK